MIWLIHEILYNISDKIIASYTLVESYSWKFKPKVDYLKTFPPEHLSLILRLEN